MWPKHIYIAPTPLYMCGQMTVPRESKLPCRKANVSLSFMGANDSSSRALQSVVDFGFQYNFRLYRLLNKFVFSGLGCQPNAQPPIWQMIKYIKLQFEMQHTNSASYFKFYHSLTYKIKSVRPCSSFVVYFFIYRRGDWFCS
jgi:hypothetical protein